MGTGSGAELALQAEVRQLRERIAELEKEQQISHRRADEEQVGRNQKTLFELVERSPFGIYIVDSEFRIAHMNASSQTGAFRNVRPVIGRPFNEAMRILWPEPVAAGIIAAFRHTLETGEPYFSPRFFNPRHDVERVEGYEWELHRMTLPDGQHGVVCYYFDSTKLLQAQAALRDSEERVRLAQTAGNVGIWDWNLRSGELRWTPELEKIYGLEPGSVRAYEDYRRCVHPEDLARAQAAWEDAVAQHRGFEVEFRVVHPSGKLVWVHSRGAATYDGEGAAVRLFGVNIDITERKQAEEGLRESEAQFRTLANAIPHLCWMASADGLRFWHNQRWYDYTGTTPEQMEGLGWQSVHDPEMLPKVQERWNASLATGELFDMVFPLRGADGVYRPFLTRMMPVRDPDGRVVRWFGTNTDISEQRQTEQALRDSEERLRLAQEAAGIGTFEWNIQTGVNTWSPKLEQLYGLPVGTFGRTQKAWEDLLHPEDRAGALERVKEGLETGEPCEAEFRVIWPDGSVHWLTGRWQIFMDASGMPLRMRGVNLDITQRKQAEERLFETNQRLQALMQALPVGVSFSDDPTCQRITGNPAVLAQFAVGPDDNLSASAPDPAAPGRQVRFFQNGRETSDTELPLQQAVRYGRVIPPVELEVRLPTGRTWFAEASGAPVLDRRGNVAGGVSVTVDITERRKSEERLRHAQKLESLGLLAGGVAHDFNNLLVGVIGNASLAQEMLPPDHAAAELMATVVRTGEQAANLTRQMLAYSGKGKFLVESLEISASVRDIIELVRPSIPKKVALHLELDQDLPPIEADRGQVQQILMNFAINAAEAIGSHDGLITVRTGIEVVDGDYLRRHPEAAELQPGPYVVLEVRDTGCGMDGAVKARIFDPFFSTKFTGRGLGLAAVAGIVRGHKGALVVTSAPGKGSTFAVLFPPAAHPAARRQDMAPNAVLQGSGVVLVIDDEQVVRNMAKRALERHGYTVLVAYGGLAAIDILKRHPGKIDVAVLDLSMPGMSGEETLPELRKIRPEVKVFVSSGYSETEAMAMFRGQHVSGFVQKPYTSATLAEKLKRALG